MKRGPNPICQLFDDIAMRSALATLSRKAFHELCEGPSTGKDFAREMCVDLLLLFSIQYGTTPQWLFAVGDSEIEAMAKYQVLEEFDKRRATGYLG